MPRLRVPHGLATLCTLIRGGAIESARVRHWRPHSSGHKRPGRVRRPETHPDKQQRQDGVNLAAHTARAMVRATRRLSAGLKRAECVGMSGPRCG
jgi:hypothetical protein